MRSINYLLSPLASIAIDCALPIPDLRHAMRFSHFDFVRAYLLILLPAVVLVRYAHSRGVDRIASGGVWGLSMGLSLASPDSAALRSGTAQAQIDANIRLCPVWYSVRPAPYSRPSQGPLPPAAHIGPHSRSATAVSLSDEWPTVAHRSHRPCSAYDSSPPVRSLAVLLVATRPAFSTSRRAT